jgi:hypothetical protein
MTISRHVVPTKPLRPRCAQETPQLTGVHVIIHRQHDVGLRGDNDGGEVPQHLAKRLLERFVLVGLLSHTSSARDLRQALNDLNQRPRYARGEYADPPAPIPVLD